MNRRALLVGLAAIALVVGVVVAASAFLGHRQGGPLSVPDRAGVIWPAAVGAEFTWAMPLDNQTTSDIVLESIAPDGVVGLEVLGVLAGNQGCDVPSIADGFPPTAVAAVDPNGAVLARSTNCALQALIGVRRLDANAPGRIDGLRIRYRFEAAAYEDVLPWSLEVKDPT